MRPTNKKTGAWLAFFVTAAALVFAAFAPAAGAASSSVRFERIEGFQASGTPSRLNKVGVLETGPRKAKNILVLNPGTSSSAAYFEPLAKTIVKQAPGWQVWAVERRENLLEDQSVANRAKSGKATPQRLFDYYLGYLTDRSVTSHFKAVPEAAVPFARKWGMRVSVEDLRRVVRQAQSLGGRVVVGGHSLGGSITSAYATWDFGGKPGARGLSGLVFIDGGSSPTPVTAEEATKSLQDLQSSSPWLSFGGIPSPLAGLLSIVGATTVKLQPNVRSTLQSSPLLPANLKAPVPATNEGAYGFALDSATSPPSLTAAQAHLGHLAARGDPRGWDRAGELTPIQRYADMFSGTGLKSLDGTAWYHPQRLTIDSGAVGAGNANPAQKVLDVRATHGADLPKGLRIYAFGAALGGTRVLDAARALATQSHISSKQLLLVDRHATYAHNDPNSASPKNDFVKNLIPFLATVSAK